MDLNLYEDQDPEIASQEMDWEPEIALNHRQEVSQLAVVAQVEHKVAMESQTRGLVNTNSDHYSKGGNLACLYSHLGRRSHLHSFLLKVLLRILGNISWNRERISSHLKFIKERSGSEIRYQLLYLKLFIQELQVFELCKFIY